MNDGEIQAALVGIFDKSRSKSRLRKSMDYNAEIDCFTAIPYQCSFLAKNLFSLVYFICFNSDFILTKGT